MGASIATGFQVEPLTCAIGAELIGLQLSDAVSSDALFAEIRALLLRHKVLFLRDQTMSKACLLYTSPSPRD